MHVVLVDLQAIKVLELWDLSRKSGVAIDSRVDEYSSFSGWRALCSEELLKLRRIADLKLILLFVILLGEHSHPDLIKDIRLGHENDRSLVAEVDDAVAVHLNHTEQVVEVGFLVIGVEAVRAVERDLA